MASTTSEEYGDEPWKDAELMDRLYWEVGLSTQELADEIGCHKTTVLRWLDNHDIPRRPSRQDSTGAWQDKDLLQKLYGDEMLSTHEIADRLGCAQKTVRRWMVRHGIDRREKQKARMHQVWSAPAPFKTGVWGYEKWHTKHDSKDIHVKVHRLIAVAEYGFDRVAGKVVHHETNIPWDNRPENLTVVTQSEHMDIHYGEDADE